MGTASLEAVGVFMRKTGTGDLWYCEALERRLLLAAGDLDTTFGSGGLQVYEDAGPALAMAIQPGGKIVVAEDNGIIDRFNADGSRDLSFGPWGTGQVSMSFAIAGIAIDPAGKIIVGGDDSAYQYSPANWYVSRLNADGSFDASFNGIDPYDQSASPDVLAPASILAGVRHGAGWLGLQSDGKVILGGSIAGGETDPGVYDYHGTTGSNVELIRFNTDGTVDHTFGDNGEAITRNGDWTSGPSAQKLFVRPDGRIVVTGLVNPAITVGEGFESTFDSSGHFVSESTNAAAGWIESFAEAMIQDGRIVGVGDNQYGRSVLDFDGRDSDFEFDAPLNTTGQTTTALGTPDGKLLIAADHAVARVNADGSPDATFGLGGTRTFVFNPYNDGWTTPQAITQLAQMADGSIILAGTIRGHLYLAKVQAGGHVVGNSPPRASVITNYYEPDNSSYPFGLTVRFFGEHPIDASTFDESDILLTGPNGYSKKGTFFSTTVSPDQSPLDVLLDFPDPGLAPSAAGVYTVHLVGRVADTTGKAVPTGDIGTFTWPLAVYPNRAPDSAPFAADILAPYGPIAHEHFMTFRARFHSPAGVDLKTLNDRNFNLTRGDGIASGAMFVSAQTSADGTTVIATYEVGAPRGGNWDDPITVSHRFNFPEEGNYQINISDSPLDKAGHTLGQYYAAGSANGPFGNFTSNAGVDTQPVAALDGVELPADGAAVKFRIRYTPPPYGSINLSSVQDNAVSVDPLNESPYYNPTWAHLEQAQVLDDGSVLATYSTAADATPGLYGIRIATPFDYNGTKRGPRDSNDTFAPSGLVGSIDTNYAYRRPSATLLTSQTTPSSRRYLSFAVRYASLAGIDPDSLDNADVRVSGPDGTFMRTRLSAVVDQTDASGIVVSYYFRVPAGASGNYRVTMGARQVGDLWGRHVSGGLMGTIEVIQASIQRRIESVPVMQPAVMGAGAAKGGIFASNDELIWDL
jgi:uncharacterized delta-60 repeat protein